MNEYPTLTRPGRCWDGADRGDRCIRPDGHPGEHRRRAQRELTPTKEGTPMTTKTDNAKITARLKGAKAEKASQPTEAMAKAVAEQIVEITKRAPRRHPAAAAAADLRSWTTRWPASEAVMQSVTKIEDWLLGIAKEAKPRPIATPAPKPSAKPATKADSAKSARDNAPRPIRAAKSDTPAMAKAKARRSAGEAAARAALAKGDHAGQLAGIAELVAGEKDLGDAIQGRQDFAASQPESVAKGA